MMDVTPDSQAVDLDEFAGDSSAGAGELDAVDEQLIARLAGRARAGGLALTGEAGLLARQTISTITDKVIEGMAEWQNRPLDPVYPVIFIDAINVKIRDGKVANRPIYVALAVTSEGRRDILGLWAGEAPSVTGAPGGEGA